MMFGRIGPMELLLIFGIALVIFGPSKLPQLGNALGQAIKEFKKGTSEISKDLNINEQPAAPAAPAAAAPAAPAAPVRAETAQPEAEETPKNG